MFAHQHDEVGDSEKEFNQFELKQKKKNGIQMPRTENKHACALKVFAHIRKTHGTSLLCAPGMNTNKRNFSQ